MPRSISSDSHLITINCVNLDHHRNDTLIFWLKAGLTLSPSGSSPCTSFTYYNKSEVLVIHKNRFQYKVPWRYSYLGWLQWCFTTWGLCLLGWPTVAALGWFLLSEDDCWADCWVGACAKVLASLKKINCWSNRRSGQNVFVFLSDFLSFVPVICWNRFPDIPLTYSIAT